MSILPYPCVTLDVLFLHEPFLLFALGDCTPFPQRGLLIVAPPENRFHLDAMEPGWGIK